MILIILLEWALILFFFYDSFKKSHNAQGGQSRVNVPAVNSSDSTNNASAQRNVQNGAHLQPQLHGVCTHLLVFFYYYYFVGFLFLIFYLLSKLDHVLKKMLMGF